MTLTARKREDFTPEKIGAYLFGALLAGLRAGIYRLLFNFYVLNQGYEESLITVLITASVMATAVSLLPLSYIADYVGRKPSLIFSIAGTILLVIVMFLFPSRMMFLMLNMMLGMFLALTQVSLVSEDARYLKLLDRVLYYSVPFAFSVFSNYFISYLPQWINPQRGASAFQNELILVGVVGIALVIFIDAQFNKHARQTTPSRVIARLDIGDISIPIMVADAYGESQEPIDPFESVAEQVNFILQGVLREADYHGPAIDITENLDGDLLVVIGEEKEYLGVEHMPDGEARTFVQRATDLWVEQQLRE